MYKGVISLELLKKYTINLLISFFVSFALMCVTALIFTYTNINDIHLQSFVLGIIVFSVLVGSTLLTRKIKQKGLVHGALFGFIFCLIVYIITAIFYTGLCLTNTLLLYLAISIVSGVVGGIIGVNI